MWLKKTDPKEKEQTSEKLRYSRYYEHDGALRAYANRAMVLAFICVPTTLLALALAAYVRLQPPTVIRVDSSGSATVLLDKPGAARPVLVSPGEKGERNHPAGECPGLHVGPAGVVDTSKAASHVLFRWRRRPP
jgi:hypothetical protein